MKLTHLAEMSKLAKVDRIMTEAASQAAAFDGINNVIADALADLSEKVAMLKTMAKETGAVKLDTVKDKNGMTVFKAIDALTRDYTKAMKKLMSEAEAMVMQVAEGEQMDGELLAESKQSYDDSGDFTEELFSVGAKIADIKKVVAQPRWTNWMKMTDHNFSTSTVSLNADFVGSLRELDADFRALEDALHSADEPHDNVDDDDMTPSVEDADIK